MTDMWKMTWVKSAHSESWACSQCAWAFKPSGPPRGTTLDEMIQNFERLRDQEFASHVCAQHPRTRGQERQNEPECAADPTIKPSREPHGRGRSLLRPRNIRKVFC